MNVGPMRPSPSKETRGAQHLSRVQRRHAEWDANQAKWPLADVCAMDVEALVRQASPPRAGLLDSRFVRRTTEMGDPPLARMAKAGSTPLKLYLWLWWHDQHFAKPTSAAGLSPGVRITDQRWAELLAFGDVQPVGNRARTVARGRKWLHDNGFVAITNRNPATLTALNPIGDKAPLTPGRPDAYLGLPDNFWTGGIITRLSARAITALLIVMDAGNPRISITRDDRGPATMVSEALLKTAYGISRDYYHDGIAELEYRNLVSSTVSKAYLNRARIGVTSETGWAGKDVVIDVAKLRGTRIHKDPPRPPAIPLETESTPASNGFDSDPFDIDDFANPFVSRNGFIDVEAHAAHHAILGDFAQSRLLAKLITNPSTRARLLKMIDQWQEETDKRKLS